LWLPAYWGANGGSPGTLALWTTQAQLAKAIGCNIVRVFGALNGVVAGTANGGYTQTQYEQHLTDLLLVFRGLGLMMGLTMANPTQRNLSGMVNYSQTAYYAALQSLWTNVIGPSAPGLYGAPPGGFQDVLAYVECGIQESTDQDAEIAVAQYWKQTIGATTPTLLSTAWGAIGPSDANPHFGITPYVDVLSMHWYPPLSGFSGTALDAANGALNYAMQHYSQVGVTLLIEETGITAAGYSGKSAWMQSVLSSCLHHPDCAGVIWWGTTACFVSGYDIWGAPSPSDLVSGPAALPPSPTGWTPTLATEVMATAAPPRATPLTYSVGLNASVAVSGSPVTVGLNVTYGSVLALGSTVNAVANFTFPITVRSAYPITLSGTITTTGTNPTTLALQASGTTVGTASIPAGATSAPFVITGTLGAAGAVNSYALALSASTSAGTATITALAGSLAIGVTPARPRKRGLPFLTGR
jgi:hypothetical protein